MEGEWRGDRTRRCTSIALIGITTNNLSQLMSAASKHSRVVSVFTAPESGAPMVRRPRVEAVAGEGLEGDRYARGVGAFSRWPGPRRQVTLITREALADAEASFGVSLSDGEHRRNVVVEGVPLKDLVKRRFRVGGAVLRGVQVCAPCKYLVRVTGQEQIFDALVGRGGLRAEVLESGPIAEGDAFVVLDGAAAPLP